MSADEVHYRGWRIVQCGPFTVDMPPGSWLFQHLECVGPGWFDAPDLREGCAPTFKAAKSEVDRWEDGGLTEKAMREATMGRKRVYSDEEIRLRKR